MCTRFTLKTSIDLLRTLYGFGEEPELEARYNIAPSQTALALFADEAGQRHAALMTWGLVDNALPTPIVNVRAETAESNPLFSESARRRRAVVIADGFYEWRDEGSRKQPYLFQTLDQQPFGMAGIFDRDSSGTTRFALLTMDANEHVRPIHDRMSLILPHDELAPWLAGTRSVARTIPLGRPIGLQRRPVDPAVNDARREGAQLLDPPRQQSLF